MRDEEFDRIGKLLTKLSLDFSSGVFSDGVLDKIEETIEFLNIQIDFSKKPPTDKLSEYYQTVDLCLQFYRLRDKYNQQD